MPIKPIDLQTLFLQLGQVGKQQAAEKDGALLHANLHGTLVKKLEAEAAKAIQRTRDEESVTESVKDDGGSGASGQGNERKRDEDGPPDKDVETISDPNLGVHVDISG